jgi:hypothetical protein
LFTGIHMTVIVVFGVVVRSCIFHGVSPCRLGCFGSLPFLSHKLVMKLYLTTILKL